MARKKEYNEQEVIEKAMALFWRNGYETTSVRMLEKEMGINQFSIYSSFDNKQGVFLESIKHYKDKIRCITDKLKKSSNGVEGIKQFFYDFIAFSKDDKGCKGCLLVNTVNELGEDTDPLIKSEILAFTENIEKLFAANLRHDKSRNTTTIKKQANYLMVSMQGLAVASKILEQDQLENYIETTFSNI